MTDVIRICDVEKCPVIEASISDIAANPPGEDWPTLLAEAVNKAVTLSGYIKDVLELTGVWDVYPDPNNQPGLDEYYKVSVSDLSSITGKDIALPPGASMLLATILGINDVEAPENVIPKSCKVSRLDTPEPIFTTSLVVTKGDGRKDVTQQVSLVDVQGVINTVVAMFDMANKRFKRFDQSGDSVEVKVSTKSLDTVVKGFVSMVSGDDSNESKTADC